MTLFDPGPPAEPAPALSVDQRRTQRRNAILANGYHPTTGRKLLVVPEGVTALTCGDCAHHISHSRARTFHKCDAARGGLTHGPGSDVRVSWPACELFTTTDPEGTHP